MKLKEQLARRGAAENQAVRNEQLLGRIYKIFTRERPTQKGFNERGQPVKCAKYGNCTLNTSNRREEAERINRLNAMILGKLQKAKPKVLTVE